MQIQVEANALKFALSKARGDFHRVQKILRNKFEQSPAQDDWFDVESESLKLACKKGDWVHARVMKILSVGNGKLDECNWAADDEDSPSDLNWG